MGLRVIVDVDDAVCACCRTKEPLRLQSVHVPSGSTSFSAPRGWHRYEWRPEHDDTDGAKVPSQADLVVFVCAACVKGGAVRAGARVVQRHPT